MRAIADQLGHSEPTIRGYLSGRTTPGVRAPRPSLLTGPLAGYCRQRFAEDPRLRPSTLFKELTELGFQASRSTFYRELTQGRLSPPGHRPSPAQEDPPQILAGVSRAPGHAPVLPRPVTPVTGEALISYLTRLAHASHLTLTEVLAVLPSWFSTKISNGDDRAQHHMLIPATADALRALARLASATPDSLARALPAFPPPRTTPSGPPPPATGAPPAAASASPSPSTCPLITRSAPATASGSATPASPTSTSPPAQRSSPPSTGPASSCAAAHPGS